METPNERRHIKEGKERKDTNTNGRTEKNGKGFVLRQPTLVDMSMDDDKDKMWGKGGIKKGILTFILVSSQKFRNLCIL